jgi:hypothetical protein
MTINIAFLPDIRSTGKIRSVETLEERPEIVRLFNEDEAIWRQYEMKRHSRRLLYGSWRMPEQILDHIDWLEAERECRQTRAIGQCVP